MEYTKAELHKIAVSFEAQPCRLFLHLLSKSDEDGNVDTSLGELHKEIKDSIEDSIDRKDKPVAVSTMSRALKKLREKKVLEMDYFVDGIKTSYKLLPSEKWKI